ncbi:MAG: transposase [Melioribacteraceae bacterium]|nr:transposase [Melioribacteraceae bacterium]
MGSEVHFHRRNLPHIYKPNSTYFVTFRIKGSIPLHKLKELWDWKENIIQAKNKEEKYKNDLRFFGKYDELLHNSKSHNYLNQREAADIVANQIKNLDDQIYNLVSYCIMPNHVHLVFSLKEGKNDVGKIMQRIKRVTAFQINKVLKKGGSFWQSECFDHVVRSESELNRIIEYVIYNPVKANLVVNWRDWEFSFCKFM